MPKPNPQCPRQNQQHKRTQIGQTNSTKTTKHKQMLNTITISVKAKENGRERMSAQLQTKRSSNRLEIENRTGQMEALEVANKRK